ncbi:MAG: cadherin repeat domain-containing protein [Planctomycetes bacterium]|nr:cadherin repeat domain-containing protein [Planctomycetota bacterium]
MDVNESPTAIQLSNDTVQRDKPAGTMVGEFSATDPDSDDTFTCELVAGQVGKCNHFFSIVGKTLYTAVAFNLGGGNGLSIRVRTTDTGGLWYERVFTIKVTEIPQARKL